MAVRIAKERHLETRARFLTAKAECTGLDADAFDLATAGQCWHWFDSGAVLAELRRVLRPGAALAIVYNTYLAEHSALARESEQLILKFNPSWTMAGSTGLHPELIEETVRGGFRLVEAFCYDIEVEFSHERWRGRMRTSNGVGSGGLSPADVSRFDDALARLLRSAFPDPVTVEHRIWCVVARKCRSCKAGSVRSAVAHPRAQSSRDLASGPRTTLPAPVRQPRTARPGAGVLGGARLSFRVRSRTSASAPDGFTVVD